MHKFRIILIYARFIEDPFSYLEIIFKMQVQNIPNAEKELSKTHRLLETEDVQ